MHKSIFNVEREIQEFDERIQEEMSSIEQVYTSCVLLTSWGWRQRWSILCDYDYLVTTTFKVFYIDMMNLN